MFALRSRYPTVSKQFRQQNGQTITIFQNVTLFRRNVFGQNNHISWANIWRAWANTRILKRSSLGVEELPRFCVPCIIVFE